MSNEFTLHLTEQHPVIDHYIVINASVLSSIPINSNVYSICKLPEGCVVSEPYIDGENVVVHYKVKV